MLALLVIVLTLATAAIHLSFFIQDPQGGVIYALNALGYVALLAMLYLPLEALRPYRRVARGLLMAYAGLTIAAYIGFGLTVHEWTIPLGPVTKLIEVVLIALLWQEGRQARAQA